jgi:hypothetical protein
MGQGRRGERTVDACQVDMQSVEQSNRSVSSIRWGKAAAWGRQGVDLVERKEMEKNGWWEPSIRKSKNRQWEPSVRKSKNDNIGHHEKTVRPQTKGTVNKAAQKQMPEGILRMSGNDETCRLKLKKKDMRQGDARLAESQNVYASPVRQGREGEKLAKWPEWEIDTYLKDTCTFEKHKSASSVGRGREGERPAKRTERDLDAYPKDMYTFEKRMERDIDAYLKDTRMTEKHTSTSSVGRGRRGESGEMPAKRLEREVDTYLKDTRTLEKHKSASPVGQGRGGERPAKRMERELYAYIWKIRVHLRHTGLPRLWDKAEGERGRLSTTNEM